MVSCPIGKDPDRSSLQIKANLQENSTQNLKAPWLKCKDKLKFMFYHRPHFFYEKPYKTSSADQS